MSYDLTQQRGSATFSTSTFKFGTAALQGGGNVYGNGGLENTLSGASAFTVEFWIYVPSSVTSGNQIAVGDPNEGWYIGLTSGASWAHMNSSFSTGPAINNNAWHHLALVYGGTSGHFTQYIDGVGWGSFAVSMGISASSYVGVGGYGNLTSYDLPSGCFLDEVSISNVAQYTANFTPPTAPFAVTRSGQIALYHLDSTATDSNGQAPSVVVPSSINGNVTAAGNVLTAATGSWTFSPSSYAYQWYSGGSAVSGATSSTYTTVSGDIGAVVYCAVTATNAFGSGTSNSTPAAQIAANDVNIVFSPFTWDVQYGRTRTINSGAYLRALINGTFTGLSAVFDLTGVTSAPTITYRVDDGPWTTVAITNSVALALPATNNWTSHVVEIVVKATDPTVNRYTTDASAVKFLGFISTTGLPTTRAIQSKGLNVLAYGDSITEGYRDLAQQAPTTGDSGGWSYAFLLRETLGAEVGLAAFTGNGLMGSTGDVPSVLTTYNQLFNTGSPVSRSFSAPVPDAILINEGQNDSGATGSTFQANYVTLLNNLLAATPSSTVIVAMRPFGGAQATYIQAACAACNAPSRVYYCDTTGWLSGADTQEGVHPFGYIDSQVLSPLTAAAIRSAFVARGPMFIGTGTGSTVKSLSPYRG
jgi:lysophospholipase L1-like esterase